MTPTRKADLACAAVLAAGLGLLGIAHAIRRYEEAVCALPNLTDTEDE